MKQQIFTRQGRTITDLRTNESVKYSSLNFAKKNSRQIQMALDNALGRGSLRVQS